MKKIKFGTYNKFYLCFDFPFYHTESPRILCLRLVNQVSLVLQWTKNLFIGQLFNPNSTYSIIEGL